MSTPLRPDASAAAAEFDTWARNGRDQSMARGHRHGTATIVEGWTLDAGSTVLDVGCGNGWALRWALERLEPLADEVIAAEAVLIHREDVAINEALGANGVPLLHGGVLHVCNTGALATGGHGTALGMIRSAWAAHGDLHVYAVETRPYLQGARLTAYECLEEGIPCTLITDSMAAAAMQSGRIQVVVAGCDRVAANGDTANKIGTYSLAVLARYHGIPVYIAMPTSTLDRRCPSGAEIPIEERPADELTHLAGVSIAPEGVAVWNPAFDVTPAELITGWVTERGLWQVPFPRA